MHTESDLTDLPTDPGLDAADHEGDAADADADPIGLLARSSEKVGPGPVGVEVSVVWGDALLDTRRFRGPVRIGPSSHRSLPERLVLGRGAAFFAPGSALPEGADFDLVIGDGAGFAVRIARGWEGFVDVGEQRFTSFAALADAGFARRTAGAFEIPLSPGVRVAVEVGGLVFFVRSASAGKRALASFSDSADWPFVGIASAVGLALVVVAALVARAPVASATDITADEQDRIVELMMQRPDPAPKMVAVSGEEGGKEKGAEGRSGKPTAKNPEAKGPRKPRSNQDVVKDSGALRWLTNGDVNLGEGTSIIAMDGGPGGWGGPHGLPGERTGVFGGGDRGKGPGGGGVEGVDGPGLYGPGHAPSGIGGPGHLTGKPDGTFAGVDGEPIMVGNIDRSLIDAVIRAHMSEIRYCYQRELQKTPDLGGKVVMKFTIATDGSVSSAGVKSSTVGSADVNQCLEGRFMRMSFPQPKKGIAIVSYPFLFSPG